MSIKFEDGSYLKESAFHFFKLLHKLKASPNSKILTPKIVSDKYKFIYVSNPLVMSSSLYDTFVFKPQMNFEARVEYIDFDQNLEAYRDYFIFSFVRNPLSRTVSCFNKKILNANTLAKLYIISRYRGLSPEMSFEEFVNWLSSKEGSDENADRHWVSQHKLLFTREGKEICSYLGKLENFKKDFRNICEHIGIEEIEPHRVASSNKMLKKPFFKQYKEYYSEELKNKIYRRYFKDFETFEYELAF